MWQDTPNPYAHAAQSPYYSQPATQGQSSLQFYAPSPATPDTTYYANSRPSLEGNMGAQGSMSMGVNGASPAYGGNIQQVGPWWTAFGTGGLEGEPPLLEGKSSLFDMILD